MPYLFLPDVILKQKLLTGLRKATLLSIVPSSESMVVEIRNLQPYPVNASICNCSNLIKARDIHFETMFKKPKFESLCCSKVRRLMFLKLTLEHH